MEIRNLGTSGLRVSAIGLGCNNFGARIDFEATKAVIHKAFDCGITLFDTADAYGERGGSETCMGQILGEKRKEIVLATKFGIPMDDAGVKAGASRRYIMQAIEDSLRRLRTDWIDLYQLHQPDPRTPIAETLRALDDLVRQGKVRYIGCSNLPAWQVVEAQWTARTEHLHAFVSCQDEYSLLVRGIEKELIPAATKYDLGLLPYFPLASGLLTGKYRRNAPMPEGARLTKTKRLADRYMTDANWPVVEKLQAFCEARGKTMLELAFSWLLAQKPVASVIAGATRPEQVEQNVKAGTWQLTADDLAESDRNQRRDLKRHLARRDKALGRPGAVSGELSAWSQYGGLPKRASMKDRKAHTLGETTFLGGYTPQIARCGPGAISASQSGSSGVRRPAMIASPVSQAGSSAIPRPASAASSNASKSLARRRPRTATSSGSVVGASCGRKYQACFGCSAKCRQS